MVEWQFQKQEQPCSQTTSGGQKLEELTKFNLLLNKSNQNNPGPNTIITAYWLAEGSYLTAIL